uniref:RNA helicase n=1 Tax=Rousettus aegyptiacus TaxID=9407 RepID=A0A7J8BQK7_ROUAE|nr:DEAD-box helicase 49 [Rousettus aegyptiacus]
MPGFTELGLSSWLVEQCRQLGLKQPTPVQLGCIPAILEGRDCLGCAKTGSGKTAAFVLPILQKLSEDPYGIFCLVLTPTRELAYQIAEQFRVLGKPLGLKDCIIVGGMDMVAQALELSRKPHVVIATPGRLADHLRSSNTFSIKKKLEEYSVEEAEVLQILTQVNVVRRECEIKLEAANFDEKKEINKRKQLILEGKDPDLEAKRKAELAKIKQKNRRFKEQVEHTLQRQKANRAGQRGRPPRARPEAHSASAPIQGPA